MRCEISHLRKIKSVKGGLKWHKKRYIHRRQDENGYIHQKAFYTKLLAPGNVGGKNALTWIA